MANIQHSPEINNGVVLETRERLATALGLAGDMSDGPKELHLSNGYVHTDIRIEEVIWSGAEPLALRVHKMAFRLGEYSTKNPEAIEEYVVPWASINELRWN
jgi:hypothetical protein